MVETNIPDRSVACATGCIGDVCATVGTQSACGGCCGCLQRCTVRSVEVQLGHPLVREAAQERVRQLEQEGHSHAHDDQHQREELAQAAAAYAWPDTTTLHGTSHDGSDMWPWEPATGYKSSPWEGRPRQQDLVKATALLMAEWDRLERETLRAAAQGKPQLVPVALCDLYQEIWAGPDTWLIEVTSRTPPNGQYLARLAKKHGGGAWPGAGDSPRQAVFSALHAAGFGTDTAEELAANWMDAEPERQFTADDIAAMLELGPPDPAQLPSRGYHPDQAVVETDPTTEARP